MTEDYNSHNTTRLDVDSVVPLLLKLDCVRNELPKNSLNL